MEATFHIEPLKEDAKRNRYNVKHSGFGTLYKDKKGDLFLFYPGENQEWMIKRNKSMLEQTFGDFGEGERFLKREYGAWLVRDEEFVDYLMEQAKENRNGN